MKSWEDAIEWLRERAHSFREDGDSALIARGDSAAKEQDYRNAELLEALAAEMETT